MTKKSIFRDHFSWKVRTFSHARSYFRSKAQRKTRFPLVLCSLIRNFAQNLCENGLHLGKERALCTRFAPSLSHAFSQRHIFCCSISDSNCCYRRTDSSVRNSLTSCSVSGWLARWMNSRNRRRPNSPISYSER